MHPITSPGAMFVCNVPLSAIFLNNFQQKLWGDGVLNSSIIHVVLKVCRKTGVYTHQNPKTFSPRVLTQNPPVLNSYFRLVYIDRY